MGLFLSPSRGFSPGMRSEIEIFSGTIVALPGQRGKKHACSLFGAEPRDLTPRSSHPVSTT